MGFFVEKEFLACYTTNHTMLLGADILLLFGAGILGLVFGSYVNSWVWRYERQSGSLPRRSVCVHCQVVLPWHDNVPVLSCLMLRGRCRVCRGPIPRSYLAVELVSGAVFAMSALVAVMGGFAPVAAARFFVFIALLLAIAVYDGLYGQIVLPLAWAGTIFAFIAAWFLNEPLRPLALGVLVGGGFFLLQYLVSRGRWIGSGDIHLGIFLGAITGFPTIIAALFFAYVFGALVSVPLIISGRKKISSAIPFGTFLAAGAFGAMLWGEKIVGWYLSLI